MPLQACKETFNLLQVTRYTSFYQASRFAMASPHNRMVIGNLHFFSNLQTLLFTFF